MWTIEGVAVTGLQESRYLRFDTIHQTTTIACPYYRHAAPPLLGSGCVGEGARHPRQEWHLEAISGIAFVHAGRWAMARLRWNRCAYRGMRLELVLLISPRDGGTLPTKYWNRMA